ncbi:MAG TPA: tautomerase family protein [Rhodanobacteraceae bacterium]|nr:tautomerase family protein [Rhodanobacteraceae bacterium]
MPLVTVTVQKPKTVEFKDTILSAVHDALVASGVPPNDRFQRVLELDASDFRFDSTYPDLTSSRDENFVLVEILLSVGRSVKVKKQIVTSIVDKLSSQGFDPELVMVCFRETRWENWSFGGGRLLHV